jgi:hypothetical protein
MEVFSAALYFAHPELDPAQSAGLFTELSNQSRMTFMNADKFICQEFDDRSLLALHDTRVQTSFNVM